MQTGLGAVIFLTFCIIIVFGCGAFLVYRVMTKPGMHIGSRLPKYDPDAEADPTDPHSPTDPHNPNGRDSPNGRNAPDDRDSPGPDDGEDPPPPHP